MDFQNFARAEALVDRFPHCVALTSTFVLRRAVGGGGYCDLADSSEPAEFCRGPFKANGPSVPAERPFLISIQRRTRRRSLVRLRTNHAPWHRQSLNVNRLVAAGIFAVVAVTTLLVTRDPSAVPVVVAPVALAYGVRPPLAEQ